MAEASRTSEARRDAVFGRWVILSPARSRRPTDLKSHGPANPSPGSGPGDRNAPKPSCPFCLGRESECAPEIFRVPAPDAPSPWRIRVIENLFPALRREVEPPPPSEEVEGPVGAGECAVRGFGFHDVVIETPRHDVRLWDLDAEGVGDVLLAYARRVRQLAEHPAVKYVQVILYINFSAYAYYSYCTRFYSWVYSHLTNGQFIA
jgi:UDPglucose--hexose-1-phosphate uridylyltransferase